MIIWLKTCVPVKEQKNPTSVKKIRGCKVASGPKRTYCRKAKKQDQKNTKDTFSSEEFKKEEKGDSKKYRKRGGGTGCAPQPFVEPYGSNLSELPGVSWCTRRHHYFQQT